MLNAKHRADRAGFGLGRRDFLRLSAGTTFLATAACGVATRLDVGVPKGLLPEGPAALDARRFFVLAALVEAMYPARAEGPSGLSVGVPQRIDREIWFMAPLLRAQLELALDVLEYGGLAAGWWGRFSRLAPERRLRGLEAMLNHRFTVLRQVATALTQLVKGMYYADPAVWAGIGYDGPWMPPKAPESIAAYPHLGGEGEG